MSFSNDVREEIARSITDRDRQFACLYGILLYSRIFTQEQVVLQSETTAFLAAAQARGCKVQVGTDMEFEQIPVYLEYFGLPTTTAEHLREVATIRY